jgi:hypothetical protein
MLVIAIDVCGTTRRTSSSHFDVLLVVDYLVGLPISWIRISIAILTQVISSIAIAIAIAVYKCNV